MICYKADAFSHDVSLTYYLCHTEILLIASWGWITILNWIQQKLHTSDLNRSSNFLKDVRKLEFTFLSYRIRLWFKIRRKFHLQLIYCGEETQYYSSEGPPWWGGDIFLPQRPSSQILKWLTLQLLRELDYYAKWTHKRTQRCCIL